MPTRAQLIDSLLQESHRRGIFNGNTLVAEKGKIIFSAAIGHADASRTTPLEKDMLFNIGSISKEFDGVGIMMLKEQGKLNLDDPIGKYFSGLQEWSQKVRVKNLLQYTSGLPAPDYSKVRNDVQVWDYLKTLEKLQFEPGSDYNYNNLDVFLRKRLIEAISGMSYAAFVQKEMLQPVGIKNVAIDPTAATPRFTRSFDEAYVQDDLDTYMSGWVALNTKDLYRWITALNSVELISKEGLAELSQSYKPSSQSPLGFSVFKDGKLLYRWHHGQSDNFEGVVAWIPNPGYTIILLTNNRCNELGDHVNAIDAILRGKHFEIPKRSIELSLRVKIYHEGYEAGMHLLDSLRENRYDIFKFKQEEEELVNTGTWLLEKDRNEDGVKMLQFAAEKFPGSVEAYFELARHFYQHKKKELSFANYQKVLELDPGNVEAAEKLKQLK